MLGPRSPAVRSRILGIGRRAERAPVPWWSFRQQRIVFKWLVELDTEVKGGTDHATVPSKARRVRSSILIASPGINPNAFWTFMPPQDMSRMRTLCIRS